IPLHSLHNYDLAQLELFIGLLRQQTRLTIEFIGFEELRWPRTNRLIQRRPRADETWPN
ncbi:acetyl-CoA carboxylase, partial [Lacticaseibacillus rhamnosus]